MGNICGDCAELLKYKICWNVTRKRFFSTADQEGELFCSVREGVFRLKLKVQFGFGSGMVDTLWIYLRTTQGWELTDSDSIVDESGRASSVEPVLVGTPNLN